MCSYRRSDLRRPTAAVMPGATGTITSFAETASASATPCSGPAPPNGMIEKSRGSMPRATEFERMASAMLLLMTLMMPERGIGHAEAERLRHLLLDRLARQVRVELQVAAERQVGVEAAEHHLRVGHGRLLAAAAVAGRSGLRAGRARADVEAARLVDVGDRAAAGADRHEVDHRRQHRMAADVGVARVHDLHACRRGSSRCRPRCRRCRR